MATKATANKEVWQADGARCGRTVNNPDAPDYLKQQVSVSVAKHSKRDHWQSKAWMDGYLRVVGY